MNGDVIALALGTVLAVGALAFVLYPLFFDSRTPAPPPRALPRTEEESAIRALREIEFDRATGKLSDPDYEALRATYAERALRELRGSAPAVASVPAVDDDIEARVKAYRAARPECNRCGLRPEPDAIYCSTCGDFLGGSCPSCSAPVTETAPTFCSTCGVPLTAQTVGA